MKKRSVRSLILLALTILIGALPTMVGQAKPHRSPHHRIKPPKPSPAFELDPLRIVKYLSGSGGSSHDDDEHHDTSNQVGPNVIIAMDTSLRMQYDFDGTYYDLRATTRASNVALATSLGVSASATNYRKKFVNLVHTSSSRYDATKIDIVDDQNADYANFFYASRLGMARDGLAQVVSENQDIIQWGLIRMRYGTGVNSYPALGNKSPVYLSDPVQSLLTGDTGSLNQFKVTEQLTTTNDNANTSSSGTVIVKADTPSSSSTSTGQDVYDRLQLAPDASTTCNWSGSTAPSGCGLLPAGADVGSTVDAPIANLLTDTRAEVVRVMGADTPKFCPCRNTVVILVVGGKEGGSANPVSVAATFASVTGGSVTKPVPIYVIAIGPPSADETQLQSIATESGGKYFNVQDADEVAIAANEAVQSAYRLKADFDAGRVTEYQTVSPIIGTVNLQHAKDIDGNNLDATEVTNEGGALIPQRSNVVLTGGFTLPGFQASLRAFRTFKPVADSTKPSGYKFVKDGTRLWVASAPAAASRNIYTYIPGTGMVAFTDANATTLKTYLRQASDDDSSVLINFVRELPLGALIDSTPAIMDPPSLEPAPDADYGTRDMTDTYAGMHKDRRTLIFYGGNDGMIHAIDGRLGKEVWAFIPYNILPKLRSLLDGQSVGQFEYMVDGSAKVADVKVGGDWHTYMIMGEGPGGTFYQTFDVTEAGMGVAPDSDNLTDVLASFNQASVIPLQWALPRYSAFDYTISTDATPYGDLGSTATAIEKTVGQTWSDPAVGQGFDATGTWLMVVGSGYLSPDIEAQTARGNVRAGTTLYLVDLSNGSVISSRDVGDDSSKNTLKNSIQGDPTAIGPPDTRFINQAYAGDSEGDLWRFNFTKTGSAITLNAPVKVYDAKDSEPIFTSLALVNVGGSNQYIFFSTGIDIMPTLKKLNKFLLIGVLDNGGSGLGTKKFEISLDKADNEGGDERPTAAPAVAGDVVFFTTTTEYPNDPCTKLPEASLRALTYIGGPAYDSNGDNKITKSDKAEIKTPAGRATAVFVSDQHLYFGAGTNLEVLGDPEDFDNGVGQVGVRILSWRELR